MINGGRYKILAWWLIAFICITPALQAKSGGAANQSFKHLYTTGFDLVKSPAKWDKTDWILAGASAAFTATSIYYFDEPVQRFFTKHNNAFFDKSLQVFEYSDFYIPLTIIAGYATSGIIQQNNYTLETAYMLAESCIFNALLTRTIKIVSGRYRPSHWESLDAHNWEPLSGAHSFYSGHTSMSFAIASVIAWRYRDIKWMPWVSYGLATVAGLQRLYYNRHWMSDVLVGAATSTAIGLFIAKNDKQNALKLYPIVSPKVTGISMVIPIR